MTALLFARIVTVVCAIGLLIAAWLLVQRAAGGDWVGVVLLAAFAAADVAIGIGFAKDARR